MNVYSRGADGKTIQVVFVSGSRVFLEKLAKEITSVTGGNLKKIIYQSNAHRLAYKAKQAVCVCDLMYKGLDLAPYLKRKHKIYADYLSWRAKPFLRP